MDEISEGAIIEVRFDQPNQGKLVGFYRGRRVASWSGDEQVKSPYETWRCQVITFWDTGMMVRPIEIVKTKERYER